MKYRVVLVGLVDLSLEHARKCAVDFGSPDAWVGSSLEAALQTVRPEVVFNLIGDKGTLVWDGADSITLEHLVEPWNGEGFFQPVARIPLSPQPLPPAAAGHAGNIREFLDALDQGTAPQTVAADHLRSLAMVEARRPGRWCQSPRARRQENSCAPMGCRRMFKP